MYNKKPPQSACYKFFRSCDGCGYLCGMQLPQLNFEPYPMKLLERAGMVYIQDPIRKKYLVLQPEEWVRQHTIRYLEAHGYPLSNMAVEMGLRLGALQKRCDIVVYKNAHPVLIVECKAPDVPITQKTFDQIARYNLKLQVPALMVTNGMAHFFAMATADHYQFLPELPAYLNL
jgi:hypothetical protein